MLDLIKQCSVFKTGISFVIPKMSASMRVGNFSTVPASAGWSRVIYRKMTEDAPTTPTSCGVAIELTSKKRSRLENKKKKAAAFLKLVQNNKVRNRNLAESLNILSHDTVV